MNTGFYKDLDTNFEQALEMVEQDFTHEELIRMLMNGNIPQKQIAALMLDYLSDEMEANVLLSNLTGCDGKIREAVALRINRFLTETPECAKLFTNAEIFADASIDINANICRLVIDSVWLLKDNKNFIDRYMNRILRFIEESFVELDKFIFRDKKYVINKQLFKLYWSLEALKIFVEIVPDKKLYQVLERASQEREYTIREKVAQLIIANKSGGYDSIVERLQADDNYYVRKAINPA